MQACSSLRRAVPAAEVGQGSLEVRGAKVARPVRVPAAYPRARLVAGAEAEVQADQEPEEPAARRLD